MVVFRTVLKENGQTVVLGQQFVAAHKYIPNVFESKLIIDGPGGIWVIERLYKFQKLKLNPKF